MNSIDLKELSVKCKDDVVVFMNQGMDCLEDIRMSRQLNMVLRDDGNGRFYLSADEKFKRQLLLYTGYNSIELKLISLILKRSANNSNASVAKRLYVDEVSGLLGLLLQSRFNIRINNDRLEVKKDENKEIPEAYAVLSVNEQNECRVRMIGGKDGSESIIIPLNQEYAWNGSQVYHVPSLGEGYANINGFEGKIEESKEEEYLSLFASCFPDVRISYRDYGVVKGSVVNVRNTLGFQLLGDGDLIKISAQKKNDKGNFPFIEKVNFSKLVHLNTQEKLMEVSDVLYPSLEGEKVLRNSDLCNAVLEDSSIYMDKINATDFMLKNYVSLSRIFDMDGIEGIIGSKFKFTVPKTKIIFKSGIDYFDTKCTLEICGNEFELEELISLHKEKGYIPLPDGTKVMLDDGYLSDLNRIFRKKNGNGGYELTLFDLPTIRELKDTYVSGRAFEQCRDIYEGMNGIGDIILNLDGLNASLREYQLYGAKWMYYLSKNNLGGCLADDMGLGKTLQTIALVNQTEETALIVVPRSLISNWVKEFSKFLPGADVHVHYGTLRKIEEVQKHRIVITTYALMKNDIESLKKIDFGFIILDEAQNIRNISSQTSRAAMLLKGRHRFALSGTPMENNLMELYSIFKFLNPAMFGSQKEFTARFENPIIKENDGNAMHELGIRIKPFILRRMKKQVASELPERTEQVVKVEMNSSQKVLYESRRLFYKEQIESEVNEKGFAKSSILILKALTELRQIATVPEARSNGEVKGAKWDVILDSIKEVTAEGHKCLVFSNFLDSIHNMEVLLSEADISFVTLTGKSSNREEIVDKFKEDENCKVFLMTLKTGGVGLNLTEADYVFILDPWWNTGAERQAIDRTHRIGQKNQVFCYRYISKDTIEEKMMELQKKKREIFDSVITAESGIMKKLCEEDIGYLLNGKDE